MLRQAGAQQVVDAYPLFWWSEAEPRHGYHIYYDLKDGTCVQIQIAQSKPSETVVGLGVGPKGRPYSGKFEWFADEKAGRISHPAMLNLDKEPNGSANGSQPLGSQTNRPQSAAGAGR